MNARLAALAISLPLCGLARAVDPSPLALEVNKSRKCEYSSLGNAVTCSFDAAGIRLTVTLDVKDPQMNVFNVENKAPDADVFLKFGGLHRCAIISRHGKSGVEYAFISPRDGMVYWKWDVPECK